MTEGCSARQRQWVGTPRCCCFHRRQLLRRTRQQLLRRPAHARSCCWFGPARQRRSAQGGRQQGLRGCCSAPRPCGLARGGAPAPSAGAAGAGNAWMGWACRGTPACVSAEGPLRVCGDEVTQNAWYCTGCAQQLVCIQRLRSSCLWPRCGGRLPAMKARLPLQGPLAARLAVRQQRRWPSRRAGRLLQARSSGSRPAARMLPDVDGATKSQALVVVSHARGIEQSQQASVIQPHLELGAQRIQCRRPGAVMRVINS